MSTTIGTGYDLSHSHMSVDEGRGEAATGPFPAVAGQGPRDSVGLKLGVMTNHRLTLTVEIYSHWKEQVPHQF